MIPADKLLHLLVGFSIAGAAHPFGLLIAALALLVAAVGKEAFDHFFHGTVDPFDAMATAWGGAVMLGWLELARAYA